MADFNLNELSESVREVLLEEGLQEALNLLQESAANLNSDNQGELDSYFLRLRDLERNNRKGFLPADQSAAQRSKLESDFLAFLRIIPKQAQAAEEVKEPPAQTGTISETVRKSIQNQVTQGRLDAAFKILEGEKEHLSLDLQNRATALSASWKDLRRSKNMGLLDFSTISLRSNQITMSLLDLISE